MFIVTRTQVRPDTSVGFYIPQWVNVHEAIPEETEYCQNFTQNYVEKFIWLTTQFEYATDGLTLTMHNFWQSEEDYLIFKTDPLGLDRFNFLVDKYCQEHGLTHELTSTRVETS